MLVTPSGIVNVKFVAEENQLPHAGLAVTFDNQQQPEKAESTIPRTSAKFKTVGAESKYPTTQPSTSLIPGILFVSNSSSEQPSKAELPIRPVLSGIETEVRPEQPENAELPMLVTPSGIVIDVNPEQPSNAESSMSSTLVGIVIDIKLEQPENAEFCILITVYTRSNPS